jgi:hypothetical protein
MDIRLYYKDPSWDAACWAVTNVAGSEQALISGLTASEAMRRCNEINRRNLRWGILQRAEVKMLEYPGNPLPIEP